MMRVLDLFSGIGGFSLGLERTGGFKTVAFCEIDPFCRQVLAKHWPEVPIHDDIRTLTADKVMAYANGGCSDKSFRKIQAGGNLLVVGRKDELCAANIEPIPADVICGGFPCQPFSAAGKRRGTEDDRHLWPEMARVIAEVRPAWVIGENVTGIIGLALDGVLSDLEGMGYAVWPVVLPACAVDAPHRRDRIWIVGHSQCAERRSISGTRHGLARQDCDAQWEESASGARSPSQDVADAWSSGQSRQGESVNACDSTTASYGETAKSFNGCGPAKWLPEPPVGRVAHGVPRRVDRLRALGNAVVPQIPEIIGRAILAAEEDSNA